MIANIKNYLKRFLSSLSKIIDNLRLKIWKEQTISIHKNNSIFAIEGMGNNIFLIVTQNILNMNLDYFKKRVTCRNFSDKKVTKELIDNIIELAMHAPTCGNMQLYSVIITKEEENLEKLSALHYNQPASKAPMILTVCADFNRFTKWCEINHADAGFDNFHSFLTAATDAIILTQQIVTIAELMGLGTCYLGTVTYNAGQISDLLKLPELVVPVASISIGYPAIKEESVERLPIDSFVHQENYRNDSHSEISGFFKSKEEFAPNLGYVKDSGKENLAQVFSEIRYPRSLNEEVSKSFLELLQNKNFLK